MLSNYLKMKQNLDTARVIEEVKLQRCLWDALDPLYKNKSARSTAWKDIVQQIFGDLPENKRHSVEKLVQQRWKTARDAFFRSKTSIPNTSSAKKNKKYVFYEELSFLKHCNTNSVVEESLHERSNESSETIVEYDHPVFDTREQAESTLYPETKRLLLRQQPRRASNFEKPLDSLKQQSPELNTDDMSFFSSLGPILKDFNVEQKLDFRSRVLNAAIEVRRVHYIPSGLQKSK